MGGAECGKCALPCVVDFKRPTHIVAVAQPCSVAWLVLVECVGVFLGDYSAGIPAEIMGRDAVDELWFVHLICFLVCGACAMLPLVYCTASPVPISTP